MPPLQKYIAAAALWLSCSALQLRQPKFRTRQRRAAAAADGEPRRIILFDVMDTLVVDPFFAGMHKDLFGFESMGELYGAKNPGVYEAFEAGEIPEDELWKTYFKDGRSVDGAEARAYLTSSYDYVKGMRSLLGEIKRIGGVEVHAFSNYGPLYRLIDDKLGLSEFLSWTFVSCDTGLRKPDPAAYADVLKTLGAAPAECVFVDDSATNCAAAEAAGIASVVFSGDSAECRTGLIANGYWELRV
mmetsp:Transcript_25584/g.76820  ORF Transcript_25584/g.76820 Transcript_25584/m.76820 type:complete len:244 (+) Transcript_25584:181-912(+)